MERLSAAGRRVRMLAAVLLVAALPATGPAWALDPGLPPERHTISRWSADDGLPHSQVHAISQDRDGFIWVASWEGTARFDGRRFRQIERLDHPDGRRLASRLFWRAEDGSMLVAVDHLGLMRIPDRGDPEPACPEFPEMDAMRITRGVDGQPWVAARDGLYRRQADGACVRFPQGDSLIRDEVLALLAQPDGSLWAGNRRGLYRWHEGRTEPLGARIGLPPGEVRGLVRTDEGDVWIVGDLGVWRLRDGRLERLHEDRAEGILQDSRGTIWVAATEARLLRYRQGGWQQFDQRHGIAGYATGALFEGREGLVWFGTTHGLFRVADGPVWGFGREQGLPNDYVRSVLQTGDGQVWVGYSGGMSRIVGQAVEPIFPGPTWPAASSVLALAPASDGGVWAGTYNRGVLHVAPGPRPSVRALGDRDDGSPLAAEQVRAVLEAPDGTLWIGAERALMAWREGRLDPEPLPGLPRVPVRALLHDDEGRLWIGLLGGLARREADGRLVVLEPEVDFPARSVLDFHADADGSLWMASDRGLLRYRDGAFRLYGREQGLSGSAVFRILADAHDNLWISGNEGVIRIPRASFHAIDQGRTTRLDMQAFARDDGMPSRQANGGSMSAGWRMDNGELWVPTAAGLAVFDPDRVMEAHRAGVTLLIDEVLVDGAGSVAEAGAHTVPAGARVVIRFTGISMRNPNGLRYRYRMHGFDADWIEADDAGEVTYTNLPAGRLRFELQVVRAPGDWSRPADSAETGFKVASHWWSGRWVVMLAALGLLALFLMLHQWLGRHQRRRQRQLETQVALRTAELREKNSELEAASHERELLMKQLAHQASHDPLTGLPNRRACDEALAEAVASSRAGQAPLAVAVIDVDRFKAINDRHGHQAGDRVLARIAERLRLSLRDPGTFVGRSGGEEFMALLPGMALEQAVARLGQVRAEATQLQLEVEGEPLTCTVSIGVAALAGDEGPDAVLRRADAALYEAKRQGRNRVVAAA